METTSASTENGPEDDNDSMGFISPNSVGESNQDDVGLLQQLLHGPKERTSTLVETKQVKEVKQAYRDKHGEEVTNDFLVEEEKVNRICCIPVKQGVRWWNFITIPLVPCTVMLLMTYVNAQTIFLLRNDEYFGVKEDNLGTISSTLVLVSYPGAIIGTLSAGYFYDILGRRITLFTSFFLGSILVFCIPYTAPNVFPTLMIVRVLIQLSLSAPAANPLLADYVHKDSIGKAAVFIALGFIIGEVLSMGVLFNVTADFSRESAFLIVACVGAVFSMSFLFLVKEPQLRSNEVEMDQIDAHE